MIINTRPKTWLLAIAAAALTVQVSTAVADLSMNFLPVPVNGRLNNVVNIDCSTPTAGGCLRGNLLSDPDKTPFYQELVVDKGLSYYHVLIGSPGGEMAQEYYIAVATLANGGVSCCWSNGAPFSASSGNFNGGPDQAPAFKGWADPLGTTTASGASASGNGTGNPERVIFRQVIQDREINQETSKLSFLNKPKITQSLTNADIQALFGFDMSNSTYRDMNTIGIMTNRIALFEGGMPSFDFDVTSNRQFSKLTGGRFTFTPGLGQGESFGTFQYLEGAGFDPYTTNWFPYSNPTNIPNQ